MSVRHLPLCLLLCAAGARATVGPDVQLRFTPLEGQLPQLGGIYRFELEILSAVDAQASNPQIISGRTTSGAWDWDTHSFPLPPEFALVADTPQHYSVDLMCNDPSKPFSVSLQIDGQSLTRSFHPLPPSSELAYGGPDSSPGPQTGVPRPDPEPAEVQAPELPKGKAGKNIRVLGSFAYLRNSTNTDGSYVGDGAVVGADGVTVHVFVHSPVGEFSIASQVIGPSGGFDITFFYPWADNPSFHLRFVAANSKVKLYLPGTTIPWGWNTSVTWNFTGSTKNFGTHWPLDQGQHPTLLLLGTATKAWRLSDQLGYGGISAVGISWPDSDWPHYTASAQCIYIPWEWGWHEDTVAHEYGHHWTYWFNPSAVSGGYCDSPGRCDDSGEDCRHCLWCMENGFVAWKEGFADYFSWAVTEAIATSGYEAPLFTYDFESHVKCIDDEIDYGYDDPAQTEGPVAAFLQDVVDDTQDTDHYYNSVVKDILDLGNASVLNAVHDSDPLNIWQCITALRIEYPQIENQVWTAAAVNGFNYDSTGPGPITGLYSTSHATTGDSPDGTVELVWNPASDSQSGVRYYRIRATLSPPPAQVVGDWESDFASFETPQLDPDTYWFTVSVLDWAGNTGAGQATFGPVTIREWVPADLTYYAGPWPYALVPRTATDSSYNYAPVPATLPGNQSGTYYNIRIANLGEVATTGSPKLYFWVDGALSWYTTFQDATFPVQGQTDVPFLNIGPDVVRGGRHTLSMFVDALETLSEPNEINNRHARQYVWTPFTFSRGVSLERIAAPDAFGGIQNPTVFTAPNCDGYRFTLGSDPLVGVVVRSLFDDDDYDLRLHTASTGSQNGFDLLSMKAISARPGTALDAVFVKNDVVTPDAWDVGVYNFSDGNGPFNIRRVESTSLAVSSNVPVSFAAGELLVLKHFNIPGAWSPTYGTVRLWSNPADGPLKLQLIAADEAYSYLHTPSRTATTNAAGYASIDFSYTSTSHGLVIFREPTDLFPGKVEAPISVTVRVEPTPADLLPSVAAGWFAPVVPTNGAPGTPSSVPGPAALTGNGPVTYINAHFKNEGPNPALVFDNMTYLDGTAVMGEQLSGIGGFASHAKNFTIPVTVRGGRHTLSMFVDPGLTVAEDDEDDNRYGRQWIWSPLALDVGPALTRNAPSDPVGGWAHALGHGQALYYNCDGLRTPLPAPVGNDGYWHGVVVMPETASDVDLQLHELATSTSNGFALPLQSSSWSAGESDFLLANFRSTTQRRFDVGVLRADGTQSYAVQFVASTFLGSDPVGNFGPFALANNELLRLHELHLSAGVLVVALKELGGSVDWGMSLHRAQLPFHAKAIDPFTTMAWDQPAGWGETAVIEIPQEGNYCLAVWKATSDDRTKNGSYSLEIHQITDAPELPQPRVTALRSVQPNPFNPRTVIHYQLAERDRAQISVFDLRGALVRTLVDAVLPAGSHEAVWDGNDGGGRRVASGVYLVQLRAGDVREQRKVALTK